jgi:hypothetical protein
MPKKSKVKQIPAKAGAKAKVGSGGKVEVVLKTTKVVKDASRGKYKPRKKTTKKQDSSKKQKDALQLLREQIELEKIQALQRQSQQQQLQLTQRLPNRRSSGDINQFFKESKNTGKTEVISDLQKEVAKLREDIKKRDEKPVEKPAEEKSKFKQELETTQNEIQRLRIQRGIAKRDEEQREKNLQRQLEEVEKKQKTEQSRLRVATRKLSSEKTAREQAQKSVFQDKEEEFKIQESLTRAKRKELKKEIKREPPNTRPTVIDASGNILGLKLTDRSKEIEEKKRPTPQPEPEPSPERFKVGGEIEVPFSSQEDLLEAFRNRKNKPRPLPKEKTITEVKTDIVSSLDNQPKLAKERERERLVQQKLKIIRDEAEDDSGFETAEEIETEEEDKEQILDDTAGEIVSGATKQAVAQRKEKARRESFLQEAQSPQVEEPVLINKLNEERQKLKELQESGDKAYQERLKAQLEIQQDERVARDLLLKEARKKDFKLQSKEIDDAMRLLKEKKQKEKKKARDNLRKREQEEFLDEVAGEIVSEAVEQNLGERREQRREAGRQAVKNVFSNVMGGKQLANEIVTATQKLPRSTDNKRYSESKTQERIGDLIHSDYTKETGRLAYTQEEAQQKEDNQKFVTDIKQRIQLSFPEIKAQSNYTKEMKNRKENGLDKRLEAQIKEDIDLIKSTGKYTGKEIVQLTELLREMSNTIKAIKKIESDKRERRTGKNKPKKETQEERRMRIREAERYGGGGRREDFIEDSE